MLNNIIIAGRMVRAPELRYTQSQKPVTSFTLVVERDYAAGEKRDADFIDCVAWNNTAEFVSKWFAKGSMVIVVGRLQSRDWTDKDGRKRRAWEVIADRVYFGEAKAKDAAPAADPSRFEEMNDSDGSLPF